MNELHKITVDKINFEIQQINKEIEIVQMLKKIQDNSQLDKIEIRAAAGSLHSIYNGFEKILVYLNKFRNETIPIGGKWHSLLLQKSLSLGILSKNTELKLRELMGFRHFYRHSYGFMLDDKLLEPLLNNIDELYKYFIEDINKFVSASSHG